MNLHKIKVFNSWTVGTDVHIKQRDEKTEVSQLVTVICNTWVDHQSTWTDLQRETTCTINTRKLAAQRKMLHSYFDFHVISDMSNRIFFFGVSQSNLSHGYIKWKG